MKWFVASGLVASRSSEVVGFVPFESCLNEGLFTFYINDLCFFFSPAFVVGFVGKRHSFF